ncbi:MAG TPA: anti-sigma factor, partial [Aggregatilineales bacterium]|nr:anti-sigma factor [Aggregatilineales bacterium]
MNHHTPTSTNDCDAVRALIAEYAFGLSDANEVRLVEANLANCSEAARDLAAFREIQAEMRAGIAQIEPPASFRDRLMAAIEEPLPVAKATLVRRRVPAAWLIAAAAVLVLILTNLFWLNRVNDLTNQQSQLVAELSAQQNNAFVLTGTTNLRWVRLPASQQVSQNNTASGGPLPYALMMWNAQGDRGLLCVWGLPKLQSGTTYQLWLTRGDALVSAGTFHVDDQGKGSLLFFIPRPV